MQNRSFLRLMSSLLEPQNIRLSEYTFEIGPELFYNENHHIIVTTSLRANILDNRLIFCNRSTISITQTDLGFFFGKNPN